jgi:predicted transcriptional regulator
MQERLEELIAIATLVEDLITRGVMSVRAGAEYRDISQVMRREHFSALPVLDRNDLVVGVVSEVRRVDGVVAVRKSQLSATVDGG